MRLFGTLLAVGLALPACERGAVEPETPPTTDPQPAAQPEPKPPSEPTYTNRGLRAALFTGVVVLGRDPVTGEFGGIVASKEPASGAFVVGARAGKSAVAVFGEASVIVRDAALERLDAGDDAEAVLTAIADLVPAKRCSVLVLDADGTHAINASGLANVYSNHAENVAVQFVDIGLGKDGGEVERMPQHFAANATLPLAENLFATIRRTTDADGDCYLPECDADGARAFRSAGITIARANGGAFGEGDRFLDARVDFAGDPIGRLEGELRLWLDAFVAPRLISYQRELPSTDSPTYTRNAAWLKRLRRKVPIGQTQ